MRPGCGVEAVGDRNASVDRERRAPATRAEERWFIACTGLAVVLIGWCFVAEAGEIGRVALVSSGIGTTLAASLRS